MFFVKSIYHYSITSYCNDNEMKYIGYIESCNTKLYLIDAYVNSNTLRLLNKGLNNNPNVREIKILTSVHSRLDENFKNDYKKLRKQNEKQGIATELRVLSSSEKRKIHDRYLITEGSSYNFVSADTVSRGQYSHVTNVPDMTNEFNELWSKGIEVLKNWSQLIK